MSMVRTPLRLPQAISELISNTRGDVGLNVWIVRACAERLVREGYLSSEDAEHYIGTSNGTRRRPSATLARGNR